MTGWKPIVLAPILAVASWFAAYGVADDRGASSGDTTFAWLPLLPIIIGFLWALSAVLLLFVRSSLIPSTPTRSRTMAVIATAANVIGVGLIYGFTISNIGGDAWPDDSMAIGALVVAGLVSLLPLIWIWLPGSASSDPVPGPQPS